MCHTHKIGIAYITSVGKAEYICSVSLDIIRDVRRLKWNNKRDAPLRQHNGICIQTPISCG